MSSRIHKILSKRKFKRTAVSGLTLQPDWNWAKVGDLHDGGPQEQNKSDSPLGVFKHRHMMDGEV